jgi:hypothetical protein
MAKSSGRAVVLLENRHIDIRYTGWRCFHPKGGLHVAEMATRWRRPTARPMVTVAELLARAAAVPRGSACTPVVSDHTPGVSVDALLRREGRATPAKDRPAHPHARRSAIPDGGSPGRTRRAAVAASTLLAAGSVVGVSLSSNSTGYAELGNTAQPVNAPPVGQSPPAPAGGQNIVPGEQAPVLGATASTGALAAGSGPSADWTAVAFPPTAGSRAADPSVGSAKTSDTTADAAIASGDKTSAADPEPRGDEDTSGSDDDGNGGTPSSSSRARGSVSTPASSTPPDDDVVLADGGPAEPAPATSEALIPGGAAPDVPAPDSTTPDSTTPDSTTPDTTPDSTTPDSTTPDSTTPDSTTPDSTTPDSGAPDGGESGEESSGGAGSVDDPDDQDTPPAADDSTEQSPDALDESGSSTDTESGTDEGTGGSDAESGSSSSDEPDSAAEASDGGDGSAGEPAA